MTNVPTELLRTLVTVVDLRSFTKAAHALGMTQPAVSAQIKRLQVLLGGELLDKSAPGVALTRKGQTLVQHARELLAINDRIVGIAKPDAAPALRIGIADELQPAFLADVLGACRMRNSAPFEIRDSDDPVRDLQQGELDVAIGIQAYGTTSDPRHSWSESLAWVCAPGLAFNRAGPLPIVLPQAGGEIARLATSALDRAGAEWQSVCCVPALESCVTAAAAGIGIAVALERQASGTLARCEDPRLPRLPELTCAIHLPETPRSGATQIADAVAEILRPAIPAPSAIPPDIEEPATQLETER
jgi:DNA-binding transcriptional LysR family regulator